MKEEEEPASAEKEEVVVTKAESVEPWPARPGQKEGFAWAMACEQRQWQRRRRRNPSKAPSRRQSKKRMLPLRQPWMSTEPVMP